MDYWNITKLSANQKSLFDLFQKLEPEGLPPESIPSSSLIHLPRKQDVKEQ